MSVDVIQISDQLQAEANELLNSPSLWSPFSTSGTIRVSGSAYLGVLIFPDLDVYFEEAEGCPILEVFSNAAKQFITNEQITSLEFEKNMHKRYPKDVPEGLFLQYWIHNGLRLWKVDIWCVKDKGILRKKLKETTDLKARIGPKQRELILAAKYKLMLPFGRTPVGSSYLVYQAALKQRLDSVEEIISYVRARGGNVDKLK